MNLKTTIKLLIALVICPGFGGCDGSMGQIDRRVALKAGLEESRKSQAFDPLKVGESPDAARLRSFLQAVLASTENSSKKTAYQVDMSVSIPMDDGNGFRMSDRIEVAMESPARWRVSHATEWGIDEQTRRAGRRCTRLGERFFIGAEFGPMTEFGPRAREDAHDDCRHRVARDQGEAFPIMKSSPS